VALVRGRREALSLEHVTEMGAAAGAAHVDAPHTDGDVIEPLHGVGVRRGVEGGPAAVGYELGGCCKLLGAGALAGIGARRPDLLVVTGSGAVGPALSEGLVRTGGEAFTPLQIADGDRVRTGADGFGGHLGASDSATPQGVAHTSG